MGQSAFTPKAIIGVDSLSVVGRTDSGTGKADSIDFGEFYAAWIDSLTTTEPVAPNVWWFDESAGIPKQSEGIPPTIDTQPQDTEVSPGDDATFSVVYTNGESVQWYADGEAIVGATSDSYVRTTVEDDNGLEIICVVTGPGGSTTSDAATLVVAVAPEVRTSSIGNVLSFDGIDDWVQIDDIAPTLEGSDKIEVKLGFRTSQSTGAGNSNMLFSLHTASGGNVLRIAVSPANGGIYCGTPAGADATAGSGYNNGEPHSLRCVIDTVAGDFDVYVDDVLVDTFATTSVDFSEITLASIGQEYDGASKGDYFDGEIWDASVFADDSLVCWFRMDEGAGSTLADSSSNAVSPSVFGATWTTIALALVIVAQPASTTADVSEFASVGVAAKNAASYQWKADGVAISGETSSVLEFESVQAGDYGVDYTCDLVGIDGDTATTNAAQISAAPAVSGFPVNVGFITDLHLGDAANYGDKRPTEGQDKLDDAIAAFATESLGGLVLNGDMIDGESGATQAQSDIASILTDAGALSVPIAVTVGNHEYGALNRSQILAAYKIPRGHGHVDLGSACRLVSIDQTYGLASGNPSFRGGDYTQLNGVVPSDQLTWLAKVLNTARSCLVFSHWRLNDENAAQNVKNASAVRAVLEAAGNVKGVFTGHAHTNAYNLINGIPYYNMMAATVGADPLNAYAKITLDSDGITVTGYGQQTSYAKVTV
jgi:UDP-2,3-diacylglucosamine pyrophosphatase LpxH